MKKLLLLMFVFVLFSVGVMGANCGGVVPCACGDTLTASYTMSGDLDCTGHGLTINANGIIFDCTSYSITGDGDSSDYGLILNGDNNVLIKNCDIANFGRGINPQSLTNLTVNNTKITNCPYGINIATTISNSTFDNITISGSNQRSISFGFNVINTTIMNSNLANNSYGVWNDRSNHTKILSTNFINNTNHLRILASSYLRLQDSYMNDSRNGHAVYITTSEKLSLIDNTIIDDTNGDYNAIYFDSGNGYNVVTSNDITGFAYGVKFDSDSMYSNATLNVISYPYWVGIQTYANNTLMDRNYIYTSYWNGLQFYSYYNVLSYNNITNAKHHKIDAHNEEAETNSGHTLIYGNIITEDENRFEESGVGIFIQASINNSIYNNTLRNLVNASMVAKGISIEGGTLSYGNKVFSNNLYNISGYCFYDSANNTLWYGNNLTYCLNRTAQVFGSRVTNTTNYAKFYNNTYNDDQAIFYSFSVLGTNYTVDESVPYFKFFTASSGVWEDYDNINANIVNNTLTRYCPSSTSPAYNIGANQHWSLSQCVEGGVFPYDGLYSGAYNLHNVEVYLSDNDGTAGLIRFDGNGKSLNGNGAIIHLLETNDYGINNFRSNNIIENITFYGGDNCIRLGSSTVTNQTLRNSKFYDCNRVSLAYDGVGLNIYNNSFYNTSIFSQGMDDSSIYDNFFQGAYDNRTLDWTYGIYLYSANVNISIINNTFKNYLNGIQTYFNEDNISIIDNTFDFVDTGIRILNTNISTKIDIIGNNFSDMTGNYDTYDVGIRIRSSNNVNVLNNHFPNIYKAGLWIANASNINIHNNSFESLTYEQKGLDRWQGYNDGGLEKEYPGAIRLTAGYEGWAWNDLAETVNTNISILDNTFDGDTQTFLVDQNTTNLIHDLTDYWFVSFEYNATYDGGEPLKRYGFYNSNNHYTIRIWQFPSRGRDVDLYIVRGSDVTPSLFANRVLNFSMSKNLLKFTNVNDTSHRLSVYNLTGDNSVCNSTVALCQQDVSGRYNETLGAGGRVLIFTYDSATDPKPTSIATTVSDVGYEWINPTSFTWVQVGLGNSVISNMSAIGGNQRTYSVYIDGVEQKDIYESNTFTITSPATWLFKPSVYSSQECNALKNQIEDNFYPVIGAIGLFILCIMVVIVYLKMNDGFTTDTTGFYKLIGVVGILFIVLIATGIIVLKMIIGIC